MKYWVYKESQILGPFDKEGVSGLAGVDEGTLVCEGDPAAGSWVPASSAGLVSPGAGTLGADDLPSASGLLDQLLIDSAGLVRDDDFPGALAQDLFTDPEYKSSFGDVLSAGGPAAEAEARRARDKVSELTVQLEHLYRHIAQLEAGHTDLARRLAEKEMQLRAGAHAAPAPEAFAPPPASPVPEAPAAPAAPARTFLSPPPPAPPAAPAPPPAPEAPSDWAQSTGGSGAPLPALFGDAKPPTKVVVPGVPGLTPPTDLPSLPAEAAAPAPPPLPEIPKPAPAEAPKTQGFGKPKSFKVVPTAKTFKVIGAGDAPPPAAAVPAPTFSVPPEPVVAAAPPPAALPPVPTPAPIPVMAPPPAPVEAFSPPPPPPVTAPPAPVIVAPPVPTPAPMDFAPPAVSPFAPVEAAPTPSAPPNTLSRSAQPVPDLGATEAAPSFGTSEPPMTMARRGGAAAPEADAPSDEAARFAKPAPPETAAPKPARNNKKFLIAGGVLLTLLLGVAVIFMRQPKDDLKQMAALDDGAPRVGAVPDDAGSAPPMVKPRVAPEPAPAPAPPPGPSAEHQAAIDAVKDFPLDGGRGTVGKWLQYSYTASPGSGTEEWNASTTGDSSILVEYRFVPAPGGAGRGALYLFEVDGMGLVIGKNIEARQMLAGTPPAEAAPAPKKKAPAKKKAVKRRPVIEEPKEVPLLPLPDSGELRPPAEDDGRFGSDTINGI